MHCMFSLVGTVDPNQNIEIELDALPQLDDAVCWPDVREFQPYVRHIEWFLTEDEEGTPLEKPFVYIVVGPRRPQ